MGFSAAKQAMMLAKSSNASPKLTLLYMCQKHSLHSYHRGQNLILTEFAI